MTPPKTKAELAANEIMLREFNSKGRDWSQKDLDAAIEIITRQLGDLHKENLELHELLQSGWTQQLASAMERIMLHFPQKPKAITYEMGVNILDFTQQEVETLRAIDAERKRKPDGK